MVIVNARCQLELELKKKNVPREGKAK